MIVILEYCVGVISIARMRALSSAWAQVVFVAQSCTPFQMMGFVSISRTVDKSHFSAEAAIANGYKSVIGPLSSISSYEDIICAQVCPAAQGRVMK